MLERRDPAFFRDASRDDGRANDACQLGRRRDKLHADVLAVASQEFRDSSLDAIQAHAAKRLDVGDNHRFRVSSALERQRVEQDFQRLPDLRARSWRRWCGGMGRLVHGLFQK